MRSTIGTSSNSAGNMCRRRMAASGVAGLVFAVAIGFAAADFGSQSPPSTRTLSAVPQASTPDQLLVYLVATEAQKRALEQDVASAPEWFVETYAGADTRVRILAVGKEESLEALDRLLPEASLASGQGPGIKLVDMRREARYL